MALSALELSKTVARIKTFEKYDPFPKLEFLRPIKVIGVKNVFRDPLKSKKMIFPKNLSSKILPKVDSSYLGGT